MEAIGSAAAISQILGQVVTIWQQVELARQSVRAGSKLLADTSTQLSQLLDTMREVEQQPILRTLAIQSQLKAISVIAGELQKILNAMEILQKKSALRQCLRALGRRTRDEAELNNVLERLEKAKVELGLLINVAHVGATGEIARGLVESSQRTRSEASSFTLVEGNESHGKADQCNGIIGLEAFGTSNKVQVTSNVARENSRQQNIITGDGCRSLSLLRYSTKAEHR